MRTRLVITAFVVACGAPHAAPQAPAAPAAQPTGMPIAEWGRLTGARVASPASHGAACITGIVTDAQTGEPLPGVTVVAVAPALEETQSAVTDENGFYRIPDLPPGEYSVAFFFADITIEQDNVHVDVNRATAVYQKIDQTQAGGETVHIEARAPNVTPLGAHCD